MDVSIILALTIATIGLLSYLAKRNARQEHIDGVNKTDSASSEIGTEINEGKSTENTYTSIAPPPYIVFSVNGKESKIDIGTLSKSNQMVDDRRKRRARLELREHRRERHYYIWAILRYMVCYDELVNSTNFYDYRKALANYNESLDRLKEDPPAEVYFDIAFRFCQTEYYKRKCEHPITQEETLIVRNWRDKTIDPNIPLNKVIGSYQVYWDEVLASYKRPSARKDRLQYLIEKLEEFKMWPELKSAPGLTDKINDLQQHYSGLLEKEEGCM